MLKGKGSDLGDAANLGVGEGADVKRVAADFHRPAIECIKERMVIADITKRRTAGPATACSTAALGRLHGLQTQEIGGARRVVPVDGAYEAVASREFGAIVVNTDAAIETAFALDVDHDVGRADVTAWTEHAGGAQPRILGEGE